MLHIRCLIWFWICLCFSRYSFAKPRTAKLYGRLIQKPHAKIMRLIYTTWFKILTKKDFSAKDGKFIRCKGEKHICKKSLVLRAKNYWNPQVPWKFPRNVYDSNYCIQMLETDFWFLTGWNRKQGSVKQ